MKDRYQFILTVIAILAFVVIYSVSEITKPPALPADPVAKQLEIYNDCLSIAAVRGSDAQMCTKMLELIQGASKQPIQPIQPIQPR